MYSISNKFLQALAFNLFSLAAIHANASLPAPLPAVPDSLVAHSVAYELMISHPDSMRLFLINQAKVQGGYFTELTPNQITFRLPIRNQEALLKVAEEKSLKVINKTSQVTQLHSQWLGLQATYTAKQTLAQEYMQIVSSANSTTGRMVERELIKLTAELESVQGQLKDLSYQARYSQITFNFQFANRLPPHPTGQTPFKWVNELGFYKMEQAFAYSRQKYKSLKKTSPPNFALQKQVPSCKTSQWLDPQGNLLRYRKIKNKPLADLAFWQEVVSTRLSGGGYRMLKSRPEQDTKSLVYTSRWGAPFQGEDYAYWVQLKLNGKYIEVLELMGKFKSLEENELSWAQSLDSLWKMP